ncbi:MAG: GNAT family N-acetyltransferase [Sneathiellales bacterium]|nr:GNAT family N-acetyltransferase [Sneathiellales bacterium]
MGADLKFPDRCETERLLLRKPVTEDAVQIFGAYATDPDVARFLIWQPHKEPEETKEFIASCLEEWEESKGWPYVIAHREKPEEPIGMIHLHRTAHDISVGYVLAKSWWGQGMITEAFIAVIDLCFSQHGIYRISAFCDVENSGSARVMEKAGLTFEGILRRHTIAPSLSAEPRDCKLYAIVR